MRVRIRGPAGQSTVTLENDATVETLRQSISSQTSLASFEIKFGYPPKPLDLGKYQNSQLLTDLDIKLNGEQLIISALDTPARSSENAQHAESKPAVPSSSQPKSSLPPLSLARKQNEEMSDPPEVPVPDLGGSLVLRIMPDDNSCLFRAISSAVMSDMDAVTELRSIVAEVIQADPVTYNKVVLDNKEPDKYCRWIKSSDSWGGQVELLILSQYFQTEIFSIDVQTLRVDRYNEGAPRRCFVVYSGIHYDTIALTILGLAPEEDIKQFEPPISDEVLPHAIELCRKLQAKHYYTDTAAFTIRCNDCGMMCTGEKGATEHASLTGHYNFGEAA